MRRSAFTGPPLCWAMPKALPSPRQPPLAVRPWGCTVFVDDVDTLAEQASAAGAELLQPPTDQFHGDRTAILRDPYGHVWVFLTHVEDVTPDEIARRAQALIP
ncbi:VOC family protein [Streptomyces sp. NPDC086782]|uniref:VOC family protein n=2 Tax=Streptomyces TaxID=1883 RepID=UPI0037FEA6AC